MLEINKCVINEWAYKLKYRIVSIRDVPIYILENMHYSLGYLRLTYLENYELEWLNQDSSNNFKNITMADFILATNRLTSLGSMSF